MTTKLACPLCGNPAEHVVSRAPCALEGEQTPSRTTAGFCDEHYDLISRGDAGLDYLTLSNTVEYGTGTSAQIAYAIASVRFWLVDNKELDDEERASILFNFFAALAKRPGLFCGLANEMASEFRQGKDSNDDDEPESPE